MRDSEGTAIGLVEVEDVRRIRRAALMIPVAVFLVLAMVTFAAAPGSMVGRLLLIGVDGAFLAVFGTLGLNAARIAR
ncbi:hypothetical protein FEK35_23895 [Nocardia cyriacigeorgica]|uniref:Uncharacterized protein n=1 Tax=Nocardia cyriacigeorgica TaxID=135487 RepID=A0A5R8P8P8_9NOCA|nr:hypothetical protein [Nocardia cyriacigeorgica]TLG00292.1 hypothetical protein FEK35_23895 [Nocardia cyriacigeorgica]